jgi:hypothetical protein
MSIEELIDLRKEVRQEKDVLNGKESNQKIATPGFELKSSLSLRLKETPVLCRV